MSDLEMWGGLECSVVRIRDGFRNQIIETDHYNRIEDLDQIAELGLRTLRYPIIWETIASDQPDVCDWRWHDKRLQHLKTLGIRVIAGLVHHGSGPRYTDLLDPAFPSLLAAHAANVARRYPWIDLFTPINEPLTTARFSGLYGHWYPHGRDDRSFVRALLNQCRAISLAMKAIRRVTPSAKLIQTEDVGKVFSTPSLRYQADFENARRWLSFDVLCGALDREHSLYPFILAQGIDPRELETLRQDPCVPDVVGMNHYLTSDRYLHSRMRAFPTTFSASNGRDRYADLEAVRMPLPANTTGPKARLWELWTRYKLPISVTEVHLGCTREEQLRWLLEVWEAAQQLRGKGADIRSVTSWSLFGAVDWNSLLTRDAGCYEPGAFDARCNPPRITAVGHAVRSLAQRGQFSHPVVTNSPGWWHRPERHYGKRREEGSVADRKDRPSLVFAGDNPKWIDMCVRAAKGRGIESAVLAGHHFAAVPDSLAATLRNLRAWALIQLATGPISPDYCRSLLPACRKIGARVVLISDRAPAEPLSCVPELSQDSGFAAVHHAAENQEVRSECKAPLIFCGAPHAIDAIIDLVIDDEQGIWTYDDGTCTARQALQVKTVAR
jgi:dTDP-4-dehydrorhamnose reductase